MFIYNMVLYAANPAKPFAFTNTEKNLIKRTIGNCNNSVNFRSKGKTIELIEIQDNCITLELRSRAPIENPTLSLRGMSRALVSTGEFNEHIYRSSLFSARVIETNNNAYVDDIEVVKRVVEVFMSQSSNLQNTKEQIRRIVSEL